MQSCPACQRSLGVELPFCPHCGASIGPEPEAADPLVNTLLAGKFQILSLLGEGGMGRVYKAEQIPLGTEVCVKTLHPHLRSDRTLLQRFFREAQAASRLRHPNCVAVHDFGEAQGIYFIAMEFLRGRSLQDLLAKEGPLGVGRAVDIACQVLDVLEAAHRMHIVHRDLKPDNIMLEDLPTRRDFVKVVDFGIAKILDPAEGEARLTKTGMVFGTPNYMAPEQALGQDVDGRTDLYALGVILYEMLANAPPFEAPTASALLVKQVAEPAPPIAARRPDLPPALAALIGGALAKPREERPATALAFKEELERAVRGGAPRITHAVAAVAATPSRPAAKRAASAVGVAPTAAPPAGAAPPAALPAGAASPAGAAPAAGAAPPAALPAGAALPAASPAGAAPTAASPAVAARPRPEVPRPRPAPPPTRAGHAPVGAGPGQATPDDAEGAEAATGADACPQCGAAVPLAGKFCGECGAPLARRATAHGDRFADLRRFLPAAVVDELGRAGVSRVTGERREVVSLAVDLGGPAVHEADPEVAATLLARFATRAEEIAGRHGGIAERSADGLRILFGVPVAQADDAERAVRCALALRTLGDDLGAGTPGLSLSMGVHGGQVLLGATVAGGRLDYTPVGDAFDLARRLAGAAAAGQILVTEPIQRACRGAVRARPMPPLALKGRSAAVAVYQVTGVLVAAAGGVAQLAVPPLAGRRDELDRIRALADDLREGRLVHVTGEAGCGKTRLLEEAVRSLAGRGLQPLVVTARPGVQGRSPAIARLVEALDLRSLGLPPIDQAFLLWYLGRGAPPPHLGETELRAGTASACGAVLERSAARVPVALLLDDLQLADAATAELARRLACAPIPRVLVVAASRLGHAPPWATAQDASPASQVTTLALGALADGDVALVARGALAPAAPPPGVVEAVVRGAGGSPGLALELVRRLIDEGVLVRRGVEWTLNGDPAALPVSDGLVGLLSGRLDALPADARRLLTIAAVLGEDFPLEPLRRLAPAGMPVERVLEELEARGLVTRAPEAAGERRFSPPALRDVAYGRLVQGARQALHRQAAETLESGEDGDAETIGRHYLLGADPVKALEHLGAAARTAREGRRTATAIRVLRFACEAGRQACQLPAGERHRGRFAEDGLALGELLLDGGEAARAAEVLAEALGAVRDPTSALVVRLRAVRGRALRVAGDTNGAARELDAALGAALALRDRRLLAEVHGELGELEERRGDLDRATEYQLRALELAGAGAAGEAESIAVGVLNALGRLHLRRKNPERAAIFLGQALALAESLGDRLAIERALGNLGALHHAKGDLAAAAQFVERALELAREIGDAQGVARHLTNLGTIAATLGDRAGARRHLEAAVVAARRIGWREGMATATASLGRLRARVGR